MLASYQETGKHCFFANSRNREGGNIHFTTPLMWSHVEYARALMVREKVWWKIY